MITIKPLTSKYINHIERWRNQPEIKQYFVDDSNIWGLEQIRWWNKYQKDDKSYCFIAFEDDNPIGSVSLYADTNYMIAEFGELMIGEKSAWGKKYGTVITQFACDYGFDVLNLDMIYLEVFEDNIRAIKAYEKVGFTTKETKEVLGTEMLVMALHRMERK